MAINKKVDAKAYKQIVAAFVAIGGPHLGRAAGMTGFGTDTMKKAWETGWPDRNLGPIKYLDEFKAHVVGKTTTPSVSSSAYTPDKLGAPDLGAGSEPRRDRSSQNPDASQHKAPTSPHIIPPSALVRPAPSSLEGAIASVAETRPSVLLEEQKLTSGARHAIRGLVASITNLLAMYQPTIAGMQERLTKNLQDDWRGGPKVVLDDINTLTAMLPRVISSAKTLMEMERLLMGMPQSITEQRSPGRDDDETRNTRLTGLFRHADRGRPARVIDVQASPYEGEESTTETGT